MKQPYRLASSSAHQFHGKAIDRNRPVTFKLDGFPVRGFWGDTVLSAALASGIDTVGTHHGAPLALDACTAPPVHPRKRSPATAVPMHLLRAQDGLDLVTSGTRNRLALLDNARRLLRQTPRTLGLALEGSAMHGPWIDRPVETTRDCDVVVVGGGIAGLSAALAASDAGERVIVLEALALGGIAGLFGTVEGEDPPDSIVDRLVIELFGRDNVEICLFTEAFALSGTTVVAIQVAPDAEVRSSVVAFRGRSVVLATGSVERLPVFPGNRLPRVATASEAYRLARTFGVWPGSTALVATSAAPAYRLAMLASDAGVKVHRIVDSRLDPQSRFIEFSKAYGIPLATGLGIAGATTSSDKLEGLSVRTALSFEAVEHAPQPISTERLILCGGWQPDLALWLSAGGGVDWNARRELFLPNGLLDNVALAGAAAGHLSHSACAQSGAAAIATLLGDPAPVITEHLIDTLYETPDAAPALSQDMAAEPAYLHWGKSLAVRPAKPARSTLFRSDPLNRLADQGTQLGFADIAAAVRLGLIAAIDASVIVGERGLSGSTLPTPMPPPSVHGNLPYPDYLVGRFPNQALWTIRPDEVRKLGVGALLFQDGDTNDPASAVGVVIAAPTESDAVALVGKHVTLAGEHLVLRDLGRAVPVRLVERLDAAEAAIVEPAREPVPG